jgi:uncharacterized membrane protein
MQATPPRPRLWEIDTLRGVAVVAMAFFHFMWDLWYLRLTTQDIPGPGWQLFARSIGGTFMFLLGLSLVLSVSTFRRKKQNPWPPTLRRGLMILGFGMVISIGTYFFAGNEFVRFGILHLAGVSLILCMLFVDWPVWLITLCGLVIAWLGFFVLPGIRIDYPWLLPFGVVQRGIGMVDYYPLAPWLGISLLGVAAGRVLYANGERRFALPDAGGSAPIAALRWLGRNSLWVYLAHQPLFLALLLGGQALGLF